MPSVTAMTTTSLGKQSRSMFPSNCKTNALPILRPKSNASPMTIDHYAVTTKMAITLRPVSLRAHDWRHDRRPLSECARHAYAIAMVEAMKQYQVEGHCVAPKKPKLVDTAVFELASSFVTDIEGGSAEDVQSL